LSARNYLFAQTESDPALTRLIATAASATGFMKGAPGGFLPGWHQHGRDNSLFLATLYQRLEASYPHAGPPFYAVRLWTNLLWQPAYLAVIAVHLHGGLPDISHLSQAQNGIYVNDYRLMPGPQYRDELEPMITRAGAQLREFADTLFVEINALTKLKRVPALHLLAERMLSLMVRLRHFQPQIGVDEQVRLCALWLDAMGLSGQGALEIIALPDGGQAAIVARKGCCLDYLAIPDRLCASCPKQKKSVWVARQRDNVIAELAMRES
jgi:siderophore ferric iron reductase